MDYSFPLEKIMPFEAKKMSLVVLPFWFVGISFEPLLANIFYGRKK